MKKIDIELTNIKGLTCKDGLLATLAEWLGRDYSVLLGSIWNFIFRNKTNSVLENRIQAYPTFSSKMFEQECGIRLSYYEGTEISISDIKKSILLNKPLILHFDMYWCPWAENFFQQKHDPKHAFLVIGFDDFGFHCIDYSPRTERAFLPYEYFRKGFKSCNMIDILPYSNEAISDWRVFFKNTIDIIEKDNIFDNMRKFSRYLLESFNLNKEIEKDDIVARNRIIWEINRVFLLRVLFSDTLKNIEREKDYNVVQLCKKLSMAGDKWFLMGNLLTKLFLNQDERIIERLATRIDYIADYEENIFSSFMELYNNDSYYFSIDKNEPSKLGLLHVDLSEYVNCRAFQSDNTDSIPNLTGDGAYFLKDQQLQLEVLPYRNILHFRLHNILNGKMDNIFCKNQTIKIPQGKYSGIYLLGCSVNGNFMEELVINYLDEPNQVDFITFVDLYPPAAKFNQEIVWLGDCSRDRNTSSVDFVGALYVYHLKLNQDKMAVSIKLPSCSNMHIFSITLVD
ncbi:hypothetical protein [Natronospora cellulosivora (SeqCode)]